MKREVTAAVSSCHRLSQAFGITAFSLHLQAKFQCMLSSSSKIWPVTLLCLREISWLMQFGGLATALVAMVGQTQPG